MPARFDRDMTSFRAAVVQFEPTPDDPDPVAFVRQVAEEIRPLIA